MKYDAYIRWYSEQNVIELIEKEYTDAEKD